MFERNNLLQSLKAIGLNPAKDIFTELAVAYEQPNRHYHNQFHIANCLKLANCFTSLAQYRHEIEIALWFHDAVYDPRRNDNEEASALWASCYLSDEGVANESLTRITDMILATKHHHPCDGDAALVIDIDLAILGSDPNCFEEYDKAIRKEYAWVPSAEYRIGRQRVLAKFLQRETIFLTDVFQATFEQKARQNILRKLQEMNT